MHRMFSRTVLLALCTSAFVPPASGQNWALNRWAIPETLSTTVKGMAYGDFDGDRMLDAAVLHGDDLTLLSAPDQFRSWVHLNESISVTDLATLPRGGTDGLDAIVTVGSAGVHLWTVDANGDFVATLIDGGVCAGGTHVRAGYLVPGSPAQVVAVDADDETLVRIVNGSSGWTTSTFASAAADVVDLEILDWAADSVSGPDGADVAVATATTFTALSGTSAATLTSQTGLAQVTNLGAILDMEPIRHRGLSRDQVAIIARDTNSAPLKWLVVIGHGRMNTEVAVPLATLDVVGLAAGDLGEDGTNGDSELFISHRSSQEQVFFISQSTTASSSQSYSLGEGCVGWQAIGPEGVSFANNDARPACADFDNDGDRDVLFVCRPAPSSNPVSTIELWRSFLEPELDRRATVVDLPGIEDVGIYTFNTTEHVAVHFGLERPEEATTGATHVEIVAWVRDVGSTTTDPEPFGQFALEFPADWSSTGATDLQCDLCLDGGIYDPLEGDVLFLETRVFSYAANGIDYDVVGPTVILRLDVTNTLFDENVSALTAAYGSGVDTPNVPAPDLEQEEIEITGISEPGIDPTYDFDTGKGEFDPSFDEEEAGQGVGYTFAEADSPVACPARRAAIHTGGFTTIIVLDPFAPHVQIKPKRKPAASN